MIPPNDRHGILLRPVEEAHPIDSIDPTWKPDTPYEARDGDVVIWMDNIQGARVLQDTVNIACLELEGYDVIHKKLPDPPKEK